VKGEIIELREAIIVYATGILVRRMHGLGGALLFYPCFYFFPEDRHQLPQIPSPLEPVLGSLMWWEDPQWDAAPDKDVTDEGSWVVDGREAFVDHLSHDIGSISRVELGLAPVKLQAREPPTLE